MVFYRDDFENEPGIVVCGYYVPYTRWKNDPDNNSRPYDLYSSKILDLKDKKRSAIDYFYSLLDDEICPGVALCVVPPHSPGIDDSGVAMLARKLAANNRIDMTGCLIRTREIEKLAYGGRRDMSIHYDTIEFDKNTDIADEVILVVDDVTTTGNSLYACQDILLSHGAKRVALLALGQTIR